MLVEKPLHKKQQIQQILDVIRLLNQAIQDCNRVLAAYEDDVKQQSDSRNPARY